MYGIINIKNVIIVFKKISRHPWRTDSVWCNNQVTRYDKANNLDCWLNSTRVKNENTPVSVGDYAGVMVR